MKLTKKQADLITGIFSTIIESIDYGLNDALEMYCIDLQLKLSQYDIKVMKSTIEKRETNLKDYGFKSVFNRFMESLEQDHPVRFEGLVNGRSAAAVNYAKHGVSKKGFVHSANRNGYSTKTINDNELFIYLPDRTPTTPPPKRKPLKPAFNLFCESLKPGQWEQLSSGKFSIMIDVKIFNVLRMTFMQQASRAGFKTVTISNTETIIYR